MIRVAAFAAAAAACVISIVLGLSRLPLDGRAGTHPSGGPPVGHLVTVVAVVIGAAVAAMCALVAGRRMRGREPVRRHWVLPSRTDQATSEQLERLHRGLHAALAPSGWRRWTRATPT